MENSDKILLAQQFISNYLKKQASDKINAFEWSHIKRDRSPEICYLKVYSGDKSNKLSFSGEELIEDYDNKEWETRIIRKVKEFINTI